MTQQDDDREVDVREALSRAYLLVGWGHIDPAIEICEQVDAQLDGTHPLPQTLAGGFLVAAGRIEEGLRRLGTTVQRFPDAPMPQLQFAEACFLAGRRRQAERSMQQAGRLLDNGSDACRQWFVGLEDVWLSEVPPTVDSLPVGPV